MFSSLIKDVDALLRQKHRHCRFVLQRYLKNFFSMFFLFDFYQMNLRTAAGAYSSWSKPLHSLHAVWLNRPLTCSLRAFMFVSTKQPIYWLPPQFFVMSNLPPLKNICRLQKSTKWKAFENECSFKVFEVFLIL